MFSHISKVLKNQDLHKRDKIWAKLYCFPNFFELVRQCIKKVKFRKGSRIFLGLIEN